MAITQRMRQRTITMGVGDTAALVGTFQGAGGREGVLNGGRAARLNLTNGINEDLSVEVYFAGTRGATPVLQPPAYVLPALGNLVITLGDDASDLAAYEASIRTTTALGGAVTADWTVTR